MQSDACELLTGSTSCVSRLAVFHAKSPAPRECLVQCTDEALAWRQGPGRLAGVGEQRQPPASQGEQRRPRWQVRTYCHTNGYADKVACPVCCAGCRLGVPEDFLRSYQQW